MASDSAISTSGLLRFPDRALPTSSPTRGAMVVYDLRSAWLRRTEEVGAPVFRVRRPLDQAVPEEAGDVTRHGGRRDPERGRELGRGAIGEEVKHAQDAVLLAAHNRCPRPPSSSAPAAQSRCGSSERARCCTLGRESKGKRFPGIHERRYCHMEVTLLADLVATSDAVANTRARSKKIAALAELLRRVDTRRSGDAAGLALRGPPAGPRRRRPRDYLSASSPSRRPSRRSRSPTWTRRSRAFRTQRERIGKTPPRDPRLAAGARDQGRGELHPPALHRGAAPGSAGRPDGGRDREGRGGAG